MDGKKIANFIRWKRERLGFTQEQLAAQTGVSRQRIEAWENGEIPSTEYLLALSKALQSDVDELLVGRESFTDNSAQPSLEEERKPTVKTEREKGYYEKLNETIEKIDVTPKTEEPAPKNGFAPIERVLIVGVSVLMLIILGLYHFS